MQEVQEVQDLLLPSRLASSGGLLLSARDPQCVHIQTTPHPFPDNQRRISNHLQR